MITSIHNPRIKAARKLVDRKERYATGMLLAEGVRMIDDAVQCGIQPVVVFYDPLAAETNPAAAALLATLEAGGTDCQPCTPEVFATLTSTVTPQGLVAVLPLPLNRPLPAPLTFAPGARCSPGPRQRRHAAAQRCCRRCAGRHLWPADGRSL